MEAEVPLRHRLLRVSHSTPVPSTRGLGGRRHQHGEAACCRSKESARARRRLRWPSSNSSGTPTLNLLDNGQLYVGGNIGIGTTSPTSPLSVSGNANVTGTLTAGSLTKPSITAQGDFSVGGSVRRDRRNVGIGTTSPGASLQVNFGPRFQTTDLHRIHDPTFASGRRRDDHDPTAGGTAYKVHTSAAGRIVTAPSPAMRRECLGGRRRRRRRATTAGAAARQAGDPAEYGPMP